MFLFIAERPLVGYLGAVTGFVSSVLSFIGVLTPIIGFAGAVFGATAGFITLMIKWREYKAKTP